MRRLLTFACGGETLGATLDAASGKVGLLLVTGGSQTRIGSHRMYERLAAALAARGFACLRFDRRGVGDSSGEDPGFRGSGPDLAAAAALLRAECPSLKRLYGFGLCDGGTALVLFGDTAGLDGLIPVNPWLVEAGPDSPPPSVIRRHYRQRLTSLNGWKSIISGSVDYSKLFKGVLRIVQPQSGAPLAREVAAALARHRLPTRPILATDDATAIAADNELKSSNFKSLTNIPHKIATDSHTFARPGDEAALLVAVVETLRQMEAQAS